MVKRITLNVEGRKLHLVLGKTSEEYYEEYSDGAILGTYYGADYDVWDFPIEELLDGTIDINEDIWYWLIEGRCYETTEEVEDTGRNNIHKLLAMRHDVEMRYFFNAGLDKATGICDGEGTDFVNVHPDGSEELLGSLYGYTPGEVSRMSDIEFEQVLTTWYIPNLS